MKESDRPMDKKIEGWVRDHLQDQEKKIDPRLVLDKVNTRLHSKGQGGGARMLAFAPAPKRLGLKAWMVRGVLAATVLLALGLVFQYQPQQASADTLLRQALEVVEKSGMDRCYQVTLELHRATDRPEPLLPINKAELWTRGDRFWLKSTDPVWPLAWGRDEQKRVWVALGSKGYRFADMEIPQPLKQMIELRTLDLGILLNRLLSEEYTLETVAAGENAGQSVVIHAHRQKNDPKLPAKVELELDPSSKFVQKLALHWSFATVRFVLKETRNEPDSSYHLEGHLPGTVVSKIDETGTPLARFQRIIVAVQLLKKAGN